MILVFLPVMYLLWSWDDHIRDHTCFMGDSESICVGYMVRSENVGALRVYLLMFLVMSCRKACLKCWSFSGSAFSGIIVLLIQLFCESIWLFLSFVSHLDILLLESTCKLMFAKSDQHFHDLIMHAVIIFSSFCWLEIQALESLAFFYGLQYDLSPLPCFSLSCLQKKCDWQGVFCLTLNRS